MTTTKQTLCRPLGFYLANVATRLGFLVLICALPGLMAQAWAANPASAAAAAPAATPATPDLVLTQSVQQWVSSQQGLRPEQVQVLPMDARVRVQACARPLLMDLPFVGNETVRVRNDALDGVEFYFGKVNPGESKSYDTKVRLVDGYPTELSTLDVHLTDPGRATLADISLPVQTRGMHQHPL